MPDSPAHPAQPPAPGASGERSHTASGSAPGIFNVVLGTAGHIDHGKSSLVQALTGIHPDRLKEEQERGITIDLGFAPLLLSNGLRAGIIDVPGHERFVKNMVAGATGVDFVLLVVAADDGVMAQTREHLQIVRLLGVPDGLVVINKVDLAEPDFVELVADEIRALAIGTCLEGKPILPVSSKTGAGIPELRAELERALSGLRRRSGEGPLRMPIQRVFAKEGFGTVVTGVPTGGSVAIGDTVEILPPGVRGRVKGLHAYQQKITHGQAGHSTAINLTGIERQGVVRGMVAATPGVFRPSKLFAARLLHLPDAPYPLKHRAPVRFHAGTAEIMGKVLLLEGDSMAPGLEGFVQLLLEEPTVLCPGDRFILRHQSPVVTLGGGTILDNAPLKRKRGDAGVWEELAAREARVGDPREFLAHLLDAAPGPKALAELCAEAGLLPAQMLAFMAALSKEKEQRAEILKPNEWFAGPAVREALARQAVACLEAFFLEHPALSSVERPELKRRLSLALRKDGRPAESLDDWFDDLLAALTRRGLLRAEGNQVLLAGRERKLDARWAGRAKQAEELFRAGGLAPPEVAEVEAAVKAPPKEFKEVLRYLIETGQVVEAAPGFCFHREAYDGARAKVQEMFARKPEWTTSEIRQELGMNRKFVVPLVEYFDRQGYTVRVGDKRRLAADKK